MVIITCYSLWLCDWSIILFDSMMLPCVVSLLVLSLCKHFIKMGFWPVPLSLFSVAINGDLTQSFHAEWGLPLCLYYLCGGICQISTSSVFSGLDSVFQTVSWGKPHPTPPIGQLPSSGNGSGNLSPGIHLSLNRVWIILATVWWCCLKPHPSGGGALIFALLFIYLFTFG